jgi:hypothetical protein
MASYIQKFRNVRSWCFNLNLSDQQLAELLFQGMPAAIKDRFVALVYENLAKLVQKASAQDNRFQNSKGKYQVAHMQEYSPDYDENEVGPGEWTKNTKAQVIWSTAAREAS